MITDLSQELTHPHPRAPWELSKTKYQTDTLLTKDPVLRLHEDPDRTRAHRAAEDMRSQAPRTRWTGVKWAASPRLCLEATIATSLWATNWPGADPPIPDEAKDVGFAFLCASNVVTLLFSISLK